MRASFLTPTSIREGVRLAFDQLRANKLRSGLTIVGIVVGVATVMVMSAVVGAIRSGVMESMEAAGPKNFIVSRFDFAAVNFSSDRPPWEGTPEITPAEARLIERLPTVRRTIVDFDMQATLQYGAERVSGVQTSADGAGWEQFTVGTFVSGHNFTESDVAAARPVVVLSKPLADRLFGPLDPIGRHLRVDGHRFTVVGVFEIEGNIFASIVKNFMIVPYTAALKYLNADDTMLSILVVTATDATQADAMDDVIAALRIRRGLRPAEPNDFVIIRQDQLADSFNRITSVFFAAMIGLSSIALMVGGVGVIAIMMIAVTERTREIGVRKALGATRREILLQFLVEAVSLTLIGSIFGLLLGGSVAALLAAFTPIPAKVPLPAIVAALAMAAVAGVLFGLWPAWRASRLDPVDALRYE